MFMYAFLQTSHNIRMLVADVVLFKWISGNVEES